MDYEGRLSKLRESVAGAGADALLVTNLTNVRYLTGFSGSNGQVLVTSSGATFFTDPRYRARAADLVEGADVVVYEAALHEELAARVAEVRRIGIEAGSMTVAMRDHLASKLEGADLIATKDLVEELRRQKEPEELTLVREAVRIADEALAWLLERVGPGRTEREVALEVEVEMRRRGADSVAFEPIVGSGPLSAHIHHSPSDRVFEPGDLLLIDMGARWQGYCSDLTRTVSLGAASEHHRDVYDVVLEAQTAGIDAVGPGKSGVECDAAARRVIDEAGYGETFGHGLGHGVGLDIHESPRLHKTSEDKLMVADLVTVEPGIYESIEDSALDGAASGSGGVRIEDCVLVTEDGSEVLGKSPKDTLMEI